MLYICVCESLLKLTKFIYLIFLQNLSKGLTTGKTAVYPINQPLPLNINIHVRIKNLFNVIFTLLFNP